MKHQSLSKKNFGLQLYRPLDRRQSIDLSIFVGHGVFERFEAQMLNISTGGCLIECGENLHSNIALLIYFERRPPLPANVKWHAGQLHGCQFRVPILPKFLESIINGTS